MKSEGKNLKEKPLKFCVAFQIVQINRETNQLQLLAPICTHCPLVPSSFFTFMESLFH